jgi:hypothetical protein
VPDRKNHLLPPDLTWRQSCFSDLFCSCHQ